MSKQRVVVVTGAAAGIGLGVATRFAQDGHRVLMLDVTGEALGRAAEALAVTGAQVLARTVDVTDRAQIDTAYADARTAFGPIEVVIANAGISNMIPFPLLQIEDWQRMIDINLTGVFHTVQAAVDDMIAANWGRIVTISSQAAQSGSPMQAHYSASKGGVIGLTKALARELAANGITANTIPPSVVDTPMLRRGVEESKFPIEMVIPMIPISRPGTPADIAGACAYLASDDAAYVTGQVLGVNGGMYI
jgi:2-hydroxycyclohexanecarboxyl-CoA dehydrogenase